MALAACPQNNKSGTTDDPENADTTSDASTSTTAAASTSSGQPSTTTGETTAPSEPDMTSTSTSTATSTSTSTSTSSSSTTTLDPDTTGGDACQVDLTISLALNFDQCDESLVLIGTVHNVGTADEPVGIDVTFFEGTDASGLKLGTKPTSEPLPAGSSTDVVWVLIAPPADESGDYYVEVDSGPGGGSIVECDETNNSAVVTDAACPD